jgi:hypothetical protein
MLQQLAPGVIQGAGSLGDTSTYAIWYGSSIVGGALMNGAALWQLGSQSTAAAWDTAGTVYNSLASNLGTWQMFDPVGYGEALDFFGNLGPTPPSISSTGAGAVMGVLGGKIQDIVDPKP